MPPVIIPGPEWGWQFAKKSWSVIREGSGLSQNQDWAVLFILHYGKINLTQPDIMEQIKIVIVENDEDERYFMRHEIDAFEKFHVLGEFVSGDTLIEWLHQQSDNLPDLILSDLNMPEKNGYDILTILKADAKFASIPIFITSTSSVISVREKCMEIGASDFLLKPEIFSEYKDFVTILYKKVTELQD
jgi:CheY-like chemotaxis protein